MKAETITAIVSIIIAGIALIVSINELKLSREHDKLLVRPIITFSASIETKDIYLKNVGFGPAFIDSLIIRNKVLPENKNQMQSWIDLLKSFEFPFDIMPNITEIEGVLEINNRSALISLNNESNVNLGMVLDSILLNTEFVVYYHSAYNDIDSTIWAPGHTVVK